MNRIQTGITQRNCACNTDWNYSAELCLYYRLELLSGIVHVIQTGITQLNCACNTDWNCSVELRM